MPSEVIRRWDYDPAAACLTVTFTNGRRYRYDAVPADVAAEIRVAFAKGVVFNRRIRGRYEATRLPDVAGATAAVAASSDQAARNR